MLKQVKKNDILLFYPYESMDPFLKLIKDASADPNVMTIKITIYRLAEEGKTGRIPVRSCGKWQRSHRADRTACKI